MLDCEVIVRVLVLVRVQVPVLVSVILRVQVLVLELVLVRVHVLVLELVLERVMMLEVVHREPHLLRSQRPRRVEQRRRLSDEL